MTVLIDVIVTEDFLDNHPDSSPKQHEITNTVEDEWGSWIEDSSGDYLAYFREVSPSDDYIPSAQLSNSSLKDRAHDADGYLEVQGDIASEADMVLVVDYFGGGFPGYSSGIANAGKDYRNNDITAVVDTWFEDNDELDQMTQNVRSEGVAFHEVLHQFGMLHGNDCSTLSGHYWDKYSIACVPDGDVTCNNSANPVYQGFPTSSCSTSTVRDHIDQHI